jgi:hypothetical protein
MLDGNTWAGRLQPFLKFESVIISNGIFLEWFSNWYKQDEHYI